jgi:hypothetical protein
MQKSFAEHGVCSGYQLLLLDELSLEQMGVSEASTRTTVLDAIAKVKEGGFLLPAHGDYGDALLLQLQRSVREDGRFGIHGLHEASGVSSQSRTCAAPLSTPLQRRQRLLKLSPLSKMFITHWGEREINELLEGCVGGQTLVQMQKSFAEHGVCSGYQLLLLDELSLEQMGVSEASTRTTVLDAIRFSIEGPNIADGASTFLETAGENSHRNLTRELQWEEISHGMTDEEGCTSLNAPTPGSYMVMTECAGYAPRALPPFFVHTSCDEQQVVVSLTPTLHTVIVTLAKAAAQEEHETDQETHALTNSGCRTEQGSEVCMQMFDLHTARKHSLLFNVNNQVKWLLPPGRYILNRCMEVRVPVECPDVVECTMPVATAIRFNELLLSSCACRIQRVFRHWHKSLQFVQSHSATLIQALYRGFSRQQIFFLQRSAAVMLQTLYRQHIWSTRFKLLSSCVIVLQGRYRGGEARQEFGVKRCKACCLQRTFRNFSLRKDAARRKSYAVRLQSVCRSHCQRMVFMRQRGQIIAIQRSVRCWLALQSYTAINHPFNLSAAVIKCVAPIGSGDTCFAIRVSELRNGSDGSNGPTLSLVSGEERTHTTAFVPVDANGVMEWSTDTNDFEFLNTHCSRTFEFTLLGTKSAGDDPNASADGSCTRRTTTVHGRTTTVYGRALFALKGLAGSGGRYTLALDAPNSTKAKSLVDALRWDRVRGCRRKQSVRYLPAAGHPTAIHPTRFGCVTFELNAERRLRTGSLGMWFERSRLLESPLDLRR